MRRPAPLPPNPKPYSLQFRPFVPDAFVPDAFVADATLIAVGTGDDASRHTVATPRALRLRRYPPSPTPAHAYATPVRCGRLPSPANQAQDSLEERHVPACYASTTVALGDTKDVLEKDAEILRTHAEAKNRLWMSSIIRRKVGQDSYAPLRQRADARPLLSHPPSPVWKSASGAATSTMLAGFGKRVIRRARHPRHAWSNERLRRAPWRSAAARCISAVHDLPPPVCSSMTPRTIHTTKPHASAMCCATVTSPYRYTIPTLDHAHALDTTRTIGRTRSTRRRRSSSPTPPPLPPRTLRLFPVDYRPSPHAGARRTLRYHTRHLPHAQHTPLLIAGAAILASSRPTATFAALPPAHDRHCAGAFLDVTRSRSPSHSTRSSPPRPPGAPFRCCTLCLKPAHLAHRKYDVQHQRRAQRPRQPLSSPAPHSSPPLPPRQPSALPHPARRRLRCRTIRHDVYCSPQAQHAPRWIPIPAPAARIARTTRR
ncbi:hypothetical protein C8R44DRAFT_881261 [Mycena epipterygia]|nr:hypothetical protein C8R44DRAFT_881261 [Mycena epipterygia]